MGKGTYFSNIIMLKSWTTMIYTLVLNRGGKGVRSPIDGF